MNFFVTRTSMLKRVLLCTLMLLMLGTTGVCFGQVLTFDDLPSLWMLPDGYSGFNWGANTPGFMAPPLNGAFSTINAGDVASMGVAGTGFAKGIVSGNAIYYSDNIGPNEGEYNY